MNKRVYILLENVVISSVYLSVQHLAPADYVNITFNRNETKKKWPLWFALSKIHRIELVASRCLLVEKDQEMY